MIINSHNSRVIGCFTIFCSLYTIFGEKLKDPIEIHHRGFYVALSEDTAFDDVSYLSIFSAKKQRKV